MTQPPDNNRPDWTPPAWTPPPPRGQQPPPSYGPPPQRPPFQQAPPQQPQPPQWGGGQPQYGQQPPHQGSGQWDLVQGNPPERPGGHRTRTLALAVAAIVVIAAVVGGVFLLRGDDKSSTSGGAATPQDAVTKFAEAVSKQDVDGLLSYIDPAESRTMGALITAARDKFGSTGVVAATGVPAPYLNVVLDGVQVQVDKVRDDLAFASVTGGTAAVTADPNKAPAAITNGKTKPKTTRASLGQGLNGVRIGVVQSGGRWYVSPTTTLLEAIRKQTGLPEPDFSVQPSATGGDDPQGAVTGLVNAFNQKDIRGATGFFSSKEIPALPYYYDVFASQLKGRQAQIGATVGDLQLTTQDMTNGLKKVVLKGATVTNGSQKITYANGCATVQGEQRCIPSNVRTLFGLADPFFVVEQNNGKWQISPIATITEYLRTILTDGNKNALLRRLNGEALAESAATVKIGDTSTVPLNDAGFAHIVITGTPGSCFDVDLGTDEQSFGTDGDSYSGNCPNYSMPGSGKLDAYVDQEAYAKGTAQIKIIKE